MCTSKFLIVFAVAAAILYQLGVELARNPGGNHGFDSRTTADEVLQTLNADLTGKTILVGEE